MSLLEMSFSGAVFIIAIAAIRAITIGNLPKKTFLVLWKMVLLRLLIPFTIPSIFSVYTLINHSIAMPSFLEAEAGSIVPTAPTVPQQEHFSITQGKGQPPANISSVSVWFVIWCAGLMLFAAFFAISFFRCRMEFRASLPVSHAYAEQWLKERPSKLRISIRQSDRISAPLTYGIFHPVILMPKKTDWENVNQLQFIFSHEYEHICHFDTFAKLVATLALCIHWFNPFVWMMYILFNRDMELACDESVIRQFGEKSKSAYALMLIRMEEKKSGPPSLYSNFSKNGIEERITAIMNTRRRTFAAFLSACLIVFVTASLFATSPMASTGSSPDSTLAISGLQEKLLLDKYSAASAPALPVARGSKKSSMTITHESADILYYEDGAPYIHDILTNNTDKTITKTQYCMLAYDENGSPLKLYWNFLDSSAESSFENFVQSEENILPHQTEEYRGGWSLYDGEIMKDFTHVGNGGANQAAYSLVYLKQVVFEDGTVWNNPDYENWIQAYAGKETNVAALQNYYPHEYKID